MEFHVTFLMLSQGNCQGQNSVCSLHSCHRITCIERGMLPGFNLFFARPITALSRWAVLLQALWGLFWFLPEFTIHFLRILNKYNYQITSSRKYQHLAARPSMPTITTKPLASQQEHSCQSMEYQGNFYTCTRSIIISELSRAKLVNCNPTVPLPARFIGERIKRYEQADSLLRLKMNSSFSCEHKLHHVDFESSKIRCQDGTHLFTVSPHNVQHISIIPLDCFLMVCG